MEQIGPGPVETAFDLELDRLVMADEFDVARVEMARILARAIDNLPPTQGFRLPSMMGRLDVLMERLAPRDEPKKKGGRR
ncbi:hypothetical protein [Sinomonas sp. P47F7]|uniref:hypothetical protein n=1 Tax=Sinomonas sp. P47F7 TaxID=3410987 RepID=UPI003BF53C18